jgi:hypothetical protein
VLAQQIEGDDQRDHDGRNPRPATAGWWRFHRIVGTTDSTEPSGLARRPTGTGYFLLFIMSMF